MTNAKTESQLSVEELLVSIRKAIHGNTQVSASGKSVRPFSKPPVSGSMRETRVQLETPENGLRGRVRSRSDDFLHLRHTINEMDEAAETRPAPAPARAQPASGFAGIMSGEARLDEALARLEKAGLSSSLEATQTYHEARPPFEQAPQEAAPDSDEEYLFDETAAGGQEPLPEPDPVFEAPAPNEDLHDGSIHDAGPDMAALQTPQYDNQGHDEAHYQYDEPVSGPQYSDPQYADPQPGAPLEPCAPLEPAAPPVPAAGDFASGAENPLVSPASAEAASNAFNRLADTIVAQSSGGERSIEDITRELLRPMLKSWLDEHLPRIVERLVRDEIERVARWSGKRP